MPYFNSTFAKSFNLIPTSKKVRNFFSLYGFFLQRLYGFLKKSSGNTARVCHIGKLFGAEVWTKTSFPSEGAGTQEPYKEVWRRITRLWQQTSHFSPRKHTQARIQEFDSFVDGIWDGKCSRQSACTPARTSQQHWLLHWKLKRQEEHPENWC